MGGKAYYEKNREKICANVRAYVAANQEKVKARRKKYQLANLDKWRVSSKLRRARFKAKVMSHYSNGANCCACCGVGDIRFLTLDHINNNGAYERKTFNQPGGKLLYELLLKQGFPTGFQVLCFNCNCAKSLNGGICPHKEMVIACQSS